MSNATAASTSTNMRGGKFLTFHLNGEEYGIEILKVHEIIGMMPITRVPRSPDVVRGVINLRGKVIPIMDLRRRFDMQPASETEETCIIVVQVQGVQIGVVVDSVSEVADIRSDDVEDTPSLGSDVATDYLLGIAKSGDHVKLLLDIDRVLSRDDTAALGEAVQEA